MERMVRDDTGEVTIPRVVIAGTWSGCGKTTVASGLMAAFTGKGRIVQPFKVGPDFIDPTHHTLTCGRPSRNLDPFMMGEEQVIETFARASAGSDIAVIEGVMGLYDGVDGTGCASTAHVARLLGAPVVLVIDAKGMSSTVHALINGICAYDRTIKIAGVIFNRIGSPRHRQLIEKGLTVPALGWIPKQQDLTIESRHLGLSMAHESDRAASFGAIMQEHCALDLVESVAGSAGPLEVSRRPAPVDRQEKATIGVAMDPAFCFYYQDNLDRLRSAGAGLVFFSPMTDPLPEVDGLYLGGGYPELHAEALETAPCRDQVRSAAMAGMPIYAECGGLTYLTESLSAGDHTYRMAGVLPATAAMTSRIQGLGYVQGTWQGGVGFAAPATPVSGHEFHYSRLVPDPDGRFAIALTRGKGIDQGKDGLFEGETTGCYTHAYFSRTFAEGLVGAGAAYRRL
ncbi:cobyrinate a,c-diamide synthase [Methanosphaerula subterraneus]|uniref:cobyrinate a,c-diamide synthase n=1 Tax=Methanosphaerula subterraneus TaxID=3350244 RepID=UPI003F866A3B